MSFTLTKKVVGLVENPQARHHARLWNALAQLFPVSFRQATDRAHEGLDAVVILDGDLAAGLAAARAGMPAYVVLNENKGAATAEGVEVRLGEYSVLAECLRGQTMSDRQTEPLPALPVEPGDEVVASRNGHAIWINRPAGKGACQLVAASPPELADGEFLFQHLNGGCFLRLLPLVNFLRQLTRDVDWQDAPLMACFIFDDPNLSLPTYGFLNYRQLAEHAIRHNYFVSVATVPLDTWWVNDLVSEVFKKSSPRLTLLIHGNNHTSMEMLSTDSPAGQLALAAQAMRRMDRVELKHQTSFLRIMEPPHAVISYEMFGHLLALGYEAAFGTSEHLVRHNPHIPWPSTTGLYRTELLCGGFPVIPRIRMSPNWKNEVLLAAFLRQPILLAGHHAEAKDGLKLLADFAHLVNSIQNVTWASPLEIVRSNYKYFRQKDTLNVKAYSRKFHFRVPEGVNNLFLHRPWLQTGMEGETLLIKNDGREIFQGVGGYMVGPIAVNSPGILEIYSPPTKQIDHRTVTAPRLRCWPVMRKVFTEMRDRSAPWRHSVAKMFSFSSKGSP